MSEIHFTQFLKKYGLHELRPTTDPVCPGVVLGKRFLRREVTHCGHLAEVFASMPKWFWDTDTDRANLVYGSVHRTIEVQENQPFHCLGLSTADPLPGGSEVKITISQVLGSGFRIGPGRANKFSLLALLNNLRETQHQKWKQLEDHWVALEVFYCQEAVVEFDHAADDYAWETTADPGHSSESLEWVSPNRAILRNQRQPFAFCGFKV
jgi:hypothetical protein